MVLGRFCRKFGAKAVMDFAKIDATAVMVLGRFLENLR